MSSSLSLISNLLLAALAIPAASSCLYLILLTLLSARNPLPSASSRRLRFDVIVPAHNESPVIRRTIASLQKLDWPQDCWRLLVIADNCSDDTATLARGAGARVLERQDAKLKGKGYAVAHGIAASRSDLWADAVVIIDADSEVSPSLLEAFAARIEHGGQAIQAHFGVLNPMASWRTRLLTIATAAFHRVRSRGRERLGLSCGIRGNGWCVTHRLLTEVPFTCYSLTEDIEYGIVLGLAGHRVEYADESHVNAEMVTSAATAGKQRQRWEDGRFQLIRSMTLPLLRAALQKRSAICLDLALDLLVLPLSYVALNSLLLVVVASTGMWLLGTASFWPLLGVACLMAIALYVLRGWQLSDTGTQGLLDLGRAPFFILWKLVVMLRKRESRGWVRTEREPPH